MSGFLDWLKRAWSRFAGDASSTGPSQAERSSQTEFSAEIVRITSVSSHPNADRLQIARFEMAGPDGTPVETSYECVIQKGTYKSGDLAAYLSVDCIVPTDRPEFRFLTERLDGKGKTHYRLKAARLRGVFSQGLLVDCPAGFAFGDSVAQHFDITYYSPEVAEQKGPTPATAKPKRQPEGWVIYGVESLKKAPRLFEEGEPVVITEKIHGTNFRFGWVRRRVLGIPFGWRFVVGSHRVVKSESGSAGFYGEDIWTEFARRQDLAARTKPYRGYLFVGELYGCTYTGQKIQDMTYSRTDPGLVIFDVRAGDEWLPLGPRMAIIDDIGLQHVPVLQFDDWHDGLKDLADGDSVLAFQNHVRRPHIREGIVVESLREGVRKKAKYVGHAYLLRKEAA